MGAIRAIGAVAALAALSGPALAFESLCPYSGQNRAGIAAAMRVEYTAVDGLVAGYCANVGKTAYNRFGPPQNRAVELGPIEGVTWIEAGQQVSTPGWTGFVAPTPGFLYVIGPGGIADFHFLRWSAEIEGH
jgi:hypothetical protein